MPHKPGSSSGPPPKGLALTTPTDALPGSARKVAVLTERAALGLPLFVAGDAEAPVARGVTMRRERCFRARTFLGPGGKERALGHFASAGAAADAVAADRYLHELCAVDEVLEGRGWDVDDEADCECEGGDCRCQPGGCGACSPRAPG